MKSIGLELQPFLKRNGIDALRCKQQILVDPWTLCAYSATACWIHGKPATAAASKSMPGIG